MDTNKYPRPSLPTTQQVLEDIYEPKVIKEGLMKNVLKYATDTSTDGETSCYDAMKELENNLSTQSDLFENLAMLNAQLVENVETIRKRHK